MSTPEGITEKIFAKSDKELRAKLEQSVKWIWDESGHSCERPKDVAALNKAISSNSIQEFKEMPWIGAISKLLVETAFLYLRDKYRQKAIREFMAKVESLSEQVEQLQQQVQQ